MARRRKKSSFLIQLNSGRRKKLSPLQIAFGLILFIILATALQLPDAAARKVFYLLFFTLILIAVFKKTKIISIFRNTRRTKRKPLNPLKLNLVLASILFIFLLITAQTGNISIVISVGVSLFVGFYGLQFYITYRRKQNILQSGINEIDLMSGDEFECFLELLFIQKKYKVERTPLSGDFGADLIISLHGNKTAIQAKRYSDKVGLSAVQEVVGAMAHYSCKSGMVITNNYFTPQAKKLAVSNNITLWERENLIHELIQHKCTNAKDLNGGAQDEANV